MIQYRYQLEKYRGRSTRHVCPQCGRKNVFTRYIDTENNNMYISDIVGKCNRLDKCGYHYTPHQYFTDNPWKRDKDFTFSIFQKHRDFEKMKNETPPPPKRASAGLPAGCVRCYQCRISAACNILLRRSWFRSGWSLKKRSTSAFAASLV